MSVLREENKGNLIDLFDITKLDGEWLSIFFFFSFCLGGTAVHPGTPGSTVV